MSPRRLIMHAVALIGLFGLVGGFCTPGFAADTTAKAKKKHQGETVLVAPTPAQQYDAQLQLNIDPVKSGLLKPDPVLPYQPQAPTKPLLDPKAKDNASDRPHLAPVLRESSLPESFGDRGSFLERHEFGIQLHDHF
ncbi:hypothetical protein [Aliidongia dinghuensis]|nr:hypothetical protein [Aliidongia dinghuensis]